MAVKRGRNIPRQWEKTKKHGRFAWPKRKSLYPGEKSSQNLSKSKLKRAIRDLSTEAAKMGMTRQSLLGPALGGDMDSLPDSPWFSKSPEEKYGDVIGSEDFGDEEGGGFYNEAMGLLDSDSIGTEKKEYLDVDTEGDNRYLNKLAGEEFAEKEFLKSDDDLGFAENEKDISRFLGPQYQPSTDSRGPAWRTESDENALDALARTEPERLKAERAKEISLADFKGEEEGSGWDKFKGLFASDSIGRDETLEQETKDNEELSGKIGAAAKLYSLLQPETQQAAPTIPTAKITRGSIAFPGMKLASQKPRRKYFTPKGLMA